jgi:PPOX class probable F420-dependent enzyme
VEYSRIWQETVDSPPFDPRKVATAERAEAMANATPDDSRYIALTTYRRDGGAVTTPVWAVSLDGKIYVFTASSTGKAKRVRATGRVRLPRAA